MDSTPEIALHDARTHEVYKVPVKDIIGIVFPSGEGLGYGALLIVGKPFEHELRVQETPMQVAAVIHEAAPDAFVWPPL